MDDLPQRHSIRLKDYDYSQTGAYFVTVCVQNKECLLGEMQQSKMQLSALGHLIENTWKKLPGQFPNITLDEFIVMPNHFHGIVWIESAVGAPLVGARQSASTITKMRAGTRPAPTLSEIIGAFKSISTVHFIQYQKKLLRIPVQPKLWQRNYYEHVIRNETDLNSVREYIQQNPLKWVFDPENPTPQNHAPSS